jgi:transglutaminase-like putative cysteine protease
MLVNRTSAVVLAGVVIALLVAYFWLGRSVEPVFDGKRSVRYALELRNLTANTVRNARLRVIAPLATSENQRVESIEASSPFYQVSLAAGSSALEFVVPVLPPFAAEEIWISAELSTASTANVAEAPEPKQWLAPQPAIESADASIQSLAQQLKGESDSATLAGIRDWLKANLRPSSYDAIDQGAAAALDAKRGDCTEYAYLAVALARAAGVPARPVDGWIATESGILEAAAFHTWAEVWDGERWQVLDAHPAGDGIDRSSYLAFRVLPTAESDLATSFARFAVDAPGVAVRMK